MTSWLNSPIINCFVGNNLTFGNFHALHDLWIHYVTCNLWNESFTGAHYYLRTIMTSRNGLGLPPPPPNYAILTYKCRLFRYNGLCLPEHQLHLVLQMFLPPPLLTHPKHDMVTTFHWWSCPSFYNLPFVPQSVKILSANWFIYALMYVNKWSLTKISE